MIRCGRRMSNRIQRLLAENKSQTDAFCLVQAVLLCVELEKELTLPRPAAPLSEIGILDLAARHGISYGQRDLARPNPDFLRFCRALIEEARK